MVTVEVLLQRTPLDRAEAVRREGTRKHRYIAEGGFKGLIQDIGHFVLEILRRNERIQELPSTLDHSMDFTASTTQVLIIIERFPQIVD